MFSPQNEITLIQLTQQRSVHASSSVNTSCFAHGCYIFLRTHYINCADEMSVETLRNQSRAKITLLQQRQKNTLDKTKKIIIMSSGTIPY